MSLPYGLVNVPMFFFYNNILYIQYLPTTVPTIGRIRVPTQIKIFIPDSIRKCGSRASCNYLKPQGKMSLNFVVFMNCFTLCL